MLAEFFCERHLSAANRIEYGSKFTAAETIYLPLTLFPMFWKNTHVILWDIRFSFPPMRERFRSSTGGLFMTYGRRDVPIRTLIAKVTIERSNSARIKVAMMDPSTKAAIRIPISNRPVDRMIATDFIRPIPRKDSRPPAWDVEGLLTIMSRRTICCRPFRGLSVAENCSAAAKLAPEIVMC